MAPVTLFHFVYRDSILHAMDGRIKVLCLLLLSVAASLAKSAPDYLLLTVIILSALLVSRLPIIPLIQDAKFFGFLILFVFVMNAISTPGEPIANIPLINVSAAGIFAGATFAWRLILIVILCAVVTGTTSLLVFKNVIEWYLRPIPFIPETRVATMVNLTFTLIPVILDQYSEMSTAQKARCVESRRNPVRRILFLALPLLSNIFRKTDELIYAMEARCYSETRTRAVFNKVRPLDWEISLLCVLNIVLIILF